MSRDPRALVASELAELAEAGVPDEALAARLAREPEARRALAERDPSAIFALLGAEPALSSPRTPAMPVLPARRPPAARRSARWARAALPLAASLVLAAALLVLALQPPGAPGSPVGASAAPPRVAELLEPGPDDGGERFPRGAFAGFGAEGPRALPPLVERVGSPSARVVTLVPQGEDAVALTLILDEEIDL